MRGFLCAETPVNRKMTLSRVRASLVNLRFEKAKRSRLAQLAAGGEDRTLDLLCVGETR